jgi:hypothetical protein
MFDVDKDPYLNSDDNFIGEDLKNKSEKHNVL